LAKAKSPKGKTSPKSKVKSTSAPETNQTPDPALLKQLEAVKHHVRDSFGKMAMAMMGMPRYRHHTLADLNHIIIDPLIR